MITLAGHRLSSVLSALSLTLLAGAAQGQCDFFNPPPNTDEPDAAFTDSNGDGIDGMRCGPIFVAPTGNDSNPGTIDAPLATIQAAVLQARLMTPTRPVYVSTGAYADNASLVFIDGVSVYGGYNAAAGWTRSSARSAYNPPFVSDRVVYAQPRTGPMILDSLDLHGKGASFTSGIPEFGMRIDATPSGSLELRNTRLRASARAGTTAASGTLGLNGASAVAGATGLGGCTSNCSSGSNASGGAGAGAGGAGGRGGLAAAGQLGSAGSSGAAGGTGGSSASCSGGTAGNGNPGSVGNNGPNGINGSTPALLANGNSGSPGSSGAGGGGGGGGGGLTEVFILCEDGRGGGGGGGGGGASGGSPGTGGTAGISAAAVLWIGGGSLIANSNSNFTADAQHGGNGGSGGNGGIGGTGGIGGSGPGGTGNGGNGGRGGDGGKGGGGSGGAGGGAYAILSTGAIPTFNGPTTTNLTPGNGGTGGLGITQAPNGPNGNNPTFALFGASAPLQPVLTNRAPSGARCVIRTPQDQPSAPTAALAADPNSSDAHNFTFTQPLVGGTVSQVGQSFIFFPNSGFTGWTSFSITATDSSGLASTGTAVVFVEADNTPDPCVADVDDGSGTGTPDGGVTIDDLLYFLQRFESGC